MAELSKEELESLPPTERIEKLRAIEKQRKREMEETAVLIKQSEAEIKEEQRIQSLGIPNVEPIDIAQLFAGSGEELESKVEDEHPAPAGDGEYAIHSGEAWSSTSGASYAAEEPAKVDDITVYELESKKVAEKGTASKGSAQDSFKYVRG
ncbi:MAG: hypothetical protein ABH879_01985 [archaeon]